MDSMPVNIAIFAVSIGVITQGAVWLVNAASRIARRIGVSELVIGLTVVAFGTSAPEVGVTVLAALKGAGDISVGNVVGSNIINLSIILGGTALFGVLRTPRQVVSRDGPFLLAMTALAVIFLLNDRLQLFEAVLFLAFFAVYLGYLVYQRRPVEDEIHPGAMRWHDPLLLLLGLGMVVGGAHFMVESAVVLARFIGVSEWVIGATIVAFGTSAPEVATSLAAAIKGRHAMSLGNLIGSNIFNLLLVLGIAGSIRELAIDVIAGQDLWIMAAITLIVYLFCVTGRCVARWEGIALFGMGVLYWVYSYLR
jgi:cation:H+ antiporter